jgi:hypothetical protein
MPKQPQVQGKVMQQQAVGRPVKDLPPLAVAALGEYLSRHPNMVELEQAARKIPKESLNAVLEPTDDPGGWLVQSSWRSVQANLLPCGQAAAGH